MSLTVLLAAFLWTIFHPNTSYAADVTVDNGTITYTGNTYSLSTSPSASDLQLPTTNTTLYTFTEGSQLHVLYFLNGATPTSVDKVNYAVYEQSGNSYNRTGNPIALTIGPPGSTPATSGGSTGSDPPSSCAVDGGLGWLICPVTNTIAAGMDWAFGALTGFLEVRPLELNQEDSPMRRAWSFMMAFANIAFVIGFLIIIFSQVTSIGISNYSVKKLLPRLIIAAILVNLSFIICAVAIDLSNVLGHSFQQLFIAMRNGLVGSTGNAWDIGLKWEDVVTFVLANGAIAVGAGTILAGIAANGVVASLALLLPTVLAGFLSVLVALVVMAARQALITVLTVIAPLALVAYLLPNTEKWFQKWRDLFMTMLILFPAFSLIFGGAQLAAAIIIQNAENMTVVILAMAIQVAPLIITPLLIKLGGTVLSRFAGLINNPSKGLIDRTRNWSKDYADRAKAKRMATPAAPGMMGALQRTGQRMDHKRRMREGWKSAHTAMADASWANSEDAHAIDLATRQAADEKNLGEAIAEAAYNKAKTNDVTIQKLDITVRNAKAEVDNLGKEAEAQYKNLQAERTDSNPIASHLLGSAAMARTLSQDADIIGRQIHAADSIRQEEFAKAMLADQRLQARAAGIDPHGAETALASAVSTMRNAYDKNVQEARAINDHFNLSGVERQKLALGETVEKEKNGIKRVFTAADIFAREAAIEDQLSGKGTIGQATEIIAQSGSGLKDFATTISSMMAKNSYGGKTIWGGGQTIDDVAQGNIKSMDDVFRVTMRAISKGKISPADLAQVDADALDVFAQIAKDAVKAKSLLDPSNTDHAKILETFDENMVKLSVDARAIFDSAELKNVPKDVQKKFLETIGQFDNPTWTIPTEKDA